jgi:hypothetical protein
MKAFLRVIATLILLIALFFVYGAIKLYTGLHGGIIFVIVFAVFFFLEWLIWRKGKST